LRQSAILTPDLANADFRHAGLESGLLNDGQMKRARFMGEQIIAVLRELLAKTGSGPPPSAKLSRIYSPNWAQSDESLCDILCC
jgi:hypothetical protein